MQAVAKGQGQSYSVGYKHSWDALRTICRVEGWTSLYRGYGVTLLSFGPFSALYFSFYESVRIWTGLLGLPLFLTLSCLYS